MLVLLSNSIWNFLLPYLSGVRTGGLHPNPFVTFETKHLKNTHVLWATLWVQHYECLCGETKCVPCSTSLQFIGFAPHLTVWSFWTAVNVFGPVYDSVYCLCICHCRSSVLVFCPAVAILFTGTPYSLVDPWSVPKLSLSPEPARCHALTLPKSGLT